MSFEDLSEARTKRDAKDKAIASKGKRGRKRKSPAPEAEAGAGLLASKDQVARVTAYGLNDERDR